MVTIKRINDQIFSLQSEEMKHEMTIGVEKTVGGSEFQAYLVHEFASREFDLKTFKPCTLKIGNKKWRVVRQDQMSWVYRTCQAVRRLFCQTIPANACQLKIYEVKANLLIRMMLFIADFASRIFTGKSFLKEREKAFYKGIESNYYTDNPNSSSNLPEKKEYDEGVRAIMPDSTLTSFKKLAQIAFQRYESRFVDEDEFSPQKCDTAIIWHENTLKLVKRSASLFPDSGLRREAVRLYCEKLEQEYGKKTIEKIALAYHIPLKKLGEEIALTPEIIYRFNLGCAFHDLRMRITRINDQIYLLETKNSEYKPVMVRLEKTLDPAFQYHLIEEFANKHFKKLKNNLSQLGTPSVKFGVRKWKVMRVNSNSSFRKVLSAVNRFFRTDIPNTSMQIYISQARGNFLRRLSCQIGDFFTRLFTGKSTTQRKDELYYQCMASKMYPRYQRSLTVHEVQVQPAEQTEYESGILAYSDPCFEHKGSEDGFSDSMTSLAAWAFQHYELHFSNKDQFDPDMCDTVIIWHEDKLKLVRKNCLLLLEDDGRIYRETKRRYMEYMEREFGKERLSRINKEYSLNLDIGERPLTPEHIYRLNVGLTALEASQVYQLKRKLEKLNFPRFFGYSDPFKNKDAKGQLIFPENQFRKLRAKFQGGITFEKLNDWIKRNEFRNKSLKPDAFCELMSIVDLSDSEKIRSLTGRQIRRPLVGYYSIAERNIFKPWVEQQEILQASFDIAKTRNWPYYYEYLSHVIVKKNLLRSDPSVGYRCETLIPAPLDRNKKPRWYTVTSFLANGHGLISYTLEDSCPGFNLPTIKLFQSTATASYALDSSMTIMNDFNPLNSPGYLGLKITAKKEEEFFNKRTIPVWVGYLLAAGNEEKLPVKAELLGKALNELKKKEEEPFKRRSFKKILREYDFALNKLLGSTLSGAGYCEAFKLHYRFIRVLRKLQKNYLRTNRDDDPSLQTPNEKLLEKRDAKEFDDLLQAMCSKLQKHPKNIQKKGRAEAEAKTDDDFDNLAIYDTASLAVSINRLSRKLAEHIINPNDDSFNFKYSKGTNSAEKIYQELKNPLSVPNSSGGSIEKLYEHLFKLAEKEKELPKDKLSCNIVFVGHSLGGSSAQVCLVHSLLKNGRIPLSKKSIHGVFIDEPAINDDDNEKFKEFGNVHHELFARLGIRFKINQNHEAGDIIPLGGETHLGATFSKEEEEDVARWLDFSGVVRRRLPTAKDPVIVHGSTVHGTRFDQAEKGVDYEEESFTTLDLGCFNRQSKTKDPEIEKQGLHLKRSIWRLTGLGTDYIFYEKFRATSFVFYPIRWILARRARNEITDSSYKKRALAHRDLNGQFHVTQQGGLTTASPYGLLS